DAQRHHGEQRARAGAVQAEPLHHRGQHRAEGGQDDAEQQHAQAGCPERRAGTVTAHAGTPDSRWAGVSSASAPAPYRTASPARALTSMVTWPMLIGCAQRAASARIRSMYRYAGPKMPPPRMIRSGLNRLTRFAIAMPQYFTASSSTRSA